IQSEEHPVLLALELEVERSGQPLRLSTRPLYFRFQHEYTEATFWSETAVTELAADLGAKLTPDAEVRGRMQSPAGDWVDARSESARDALAPRATRSRQGLSVLGLTTVAPIPGAGVETARAAVDPTAGELAAAVAVPAAAGVTATASVCTGWYVIYADAGYGTDYFATTGWHFEYAAYAYALLATGSGTAIWQGYLSNTGCTPSLNLAYGDYTLLQTSGYVQNGGVDFRNTRVVNGQRVSTAIITSFRWSNGVPQPIYLRPMANTSDFQTAAVTGQVLRANWATGGNVGLTAGTYQVHSDEACPSSSGDSCAVFPHIYINWANTHAWWRTIVAHEIGHAVRQNAMGSPWANRTTGGDTVDLCRCDHISADEVHCLQSRSNYGYAQEEGFAQAFATRVFNNNIEANGSLAYYKAFLESSGANPVLPPMAKDCYNAATWFYQKCNRTADTAVEWDWATFFVNVSSANRAYTTDFASLFDIYRRACGSASEKCADTDNVRWTNLRDAAKAKYGLEDPRYLRFEAALRNHKVNY
ncbi:MAG TPA: hypothetical protein PLU22_20715, partial [Polyangiaceae bacterium]|nr:hypothetical protein [Polyangiaceae bacterium]